MRSMERSGVKRRGTGLQPVPPQAGLPLRGGTGYNLFHAAYQGSVYDTGSSVVIVGNQGAFFRTAAVIRRTTSSSVGYGDFSGGRSGSGISSMRYTVPGALMPVA